MNDTLQKMLVTVGAPIIKKVLMLQATWFVSHGLLTSNYTTVYVSLGMAAAGALWSFWNDYGRAVLLAQIQIYRAKVLAQAAKLNAAGVPPVTVSQIAAQSSELTPESVAKAVAKMPPEIQATVAPVAVMAKFLLAAFVLASLMAGGNAQAAQLKRPAVTGDPIADIKTDLTPANSAPTAVVTAGQGGILTPDALIKKIIGLAGPDLSYAAAMATSANTNASNVRLGCIKAIQTLNTQASGANLKNADGSAMVAPSEPHIFTDLETIAEGIDSLSPTGPLYTSCAGAAALANTNVLTFINSIVTGTAATTLLIPK